MNEWRYCKELLTWPISRKIPQSDKVSLVTISAAFSRSSSGQIALTLSLLRCWRSFATIGYVWTLVKSLTARLIIHFFRFCILYTDIQSPTQLKISYVSRKSNDRIFFEFYRYLWTLHDLIKHLSIVYRVRRLLSFLLHAASRRVSNAAAKSKEMLFARNELLFNLVEQYRATDSLNNYILASGEWPFLENGARSARDKKRKSIPKSGNGE